MNEQPSPATLPGRAGTGVSAPDLTDPRIADALWQLSQCQELPVAEQVQAYTDIHRRLNEVLSDPASQG